MSRYKYLTLKHYREKVGCTQEDFSKLIGVTKGGYSRKENGFQPFFLHSECFIIRDHINKKLEERGEQPVTLDVLFYEHNVSNTTLKSTKKKGA